MSSFKIEQNNSAYSLKVGQLVSILQYARACTIAVVENCTKRQLDFLMDEKSNSVGTLLKHIAALEYQFQQVTFANRKLNSGELKTWKGCFADELSLNYSKNKPASYYIFLLREQRKRTLQYFKPKTNKWLLADNELYPQANNLFFWYHLIEDELCHTGQIKLMLKRAPDAAGQNA
jgi:uncharacterized damage-inducible protein DinB